MAFEITNINKKFNDVWQGFAGFLVTNQAVLAAFFLTVVSLSFFLTIGFPEVFDNLPFFKTRYFALGAVATYSIISILAVLITKRSSLRIFSILLQSNALMIASFTYFIRIFASEFSFFWVNANTNFIFLPLLLLIFFVNYNLFGEYKNYFYVTAAKVFLFIILFFSIIDFIEVDKTSLRDFFYDWLSYFFNLPPAALLGICALLVSAVSIFILDIKNSVKQIAVYFLFSFIALQSLLIVYFVDFGDFKGIGYWHKALLGFILWDYFYAPFIVATTGVKDYKYRPRLIVSTFYHLILFILVLKFNTWF